jgi:hypothetical protein
MEGGAAAATGHVSEREAGVWRPILEEMILAEGLLDVLGLEDGPDGLVFLVGRR